MITEIKLTILLLAAGTLFGHHAMEFIEMESYSTTRKAEKVFHLHYDYMVDDANNPLLDHWEFTPGFSYGITHRLMVDAHTHLAKFGPAHLVDVDPAFAATGPPPFLEALALAVQYRLTEGSFVDIAMAGVFEQPYARSQDLLGGEQVYEGLIILSREIGEHGTLAANLMFGVEGGESFNGYALGVKTPLSLDPHGIQGGIELLGDFDGGWSLLPGVYFPLGNQNTVLKTGLELGNESIRMNATLMLLF